MSTMNQIMGSAIIIGFLTAAWGKIKGLFSRAYSVFVVEIKVEGEAARAMKSYCWKDFRRSPFGKRYYSSMFEFIRPLKWNALICMEKLGTDPIIFWRGWRPLMLGATSEISGGVPNGNVNDHCANMTFIRGTFDADTLINAAIEKYNEQFNKNRNHPKQMPTRFNITRFSGMGRNNAGENGKPQLHASSSSDSVLASGQSDVLTSITRGEARLLKWGIDDVGPDRHEYSKAIDALALPNTITKIIVELEHWLKSEKWYRSKQIPWTRGWLIYGQTGCVLPTTKIRVRKKQVEGTHPLHDDSKRTCVGVSNRVLKVQQKIYGKVQGDLMQVGESREMTIAELFALSESEGGIYEIDTPDGWQEIGQLMKKKKKHCRKITCESGRVVEVSNDHFFETDQGWESALSLQVGKSVHTDTGRDIIVINEENGTHDTLDLEVLHEKHRYYANGVVSHNSGKTSLVRALGEDYDLPIYVFDIASMSNSEFINSWKAPQNNAPCIALIEDLDAVFKGRTNIVGTQGGGLTFDCVLNTLGGIDSANGVLKIITTNYPETLDEALGVPRTESGDNMSTRPGRMDQAFEITVLDDACRQQLAERILSDCPEYIAQMVADSHGQTGAQCVYKYAQIALREHWKSLEQTSTTPPTRGGA